MNTIDQQLAVKLLTQFINGIVDVSLSDYFSNYEAGGNFTIYKVRRQDNTDLCVCLFEDERHVNAFDGQIKEEIELGNHWEILGAFSGKDKISSEGNIEITVVDERPYYLYLLKER
jgi:hypothetical protein